MNDSFIRIMRNCLFVIITNRIHTYTRTRTHTYRKNGVWKPSFFQCEIMERERDREREEEGEKTKERQRENDCCCCCCCTIKIVTHDMPTSYLTLILWPKHTTFLCVVYYYYYYFDVIIFQIVLLFLSFLILRNII